MYRPCKLRCFDAQNTREGPTDTSSIHLFTCGLAVNAAISPQNRLDLEGDTRKFLVTFEHTSPLIRWGEVFEAVVLRGLESGGFDYDAGEIGVRS